VGYGDIAPQTWLGQLVASMLMIIGYAIIAVPTGIVTSEMVKANNNVSNEKIVCHECQIDDLQPTDNYCHNCGVEL
jgi:voltage-gated potassium channel